MKRHNEPDHQAIVNTPARTQPAECAQHECVDVTSLSDKRAGLRSMNDENATVSRVVAAAVQVATAAQQDYPNLHPCCNDSPTHHQEMTQLLNELTAAVTEMLDTQPETCHTPD